MAQDAVGCSAGIWIWTVQDFHMFRHLARTLEQPNPLSTQQPPPPRNCSKLPPALLSQKVTAKNDHEISFTRTGTDHKVSAMIRAAV